MPLFKFRTVIKREDNSSDESLKDEDLDETLLGHKNEIDDNSRDPEFSQVKAELLVKDGKYEEAIVCYDKILELEDGNEKLWYQKGEVFTRLERYQEAIECYKMAVQLEPKFEEAWYMLGELHKKQNEEDKAKECFSCVLEINPDNTKAKKALLPLNDDRTISVKNNDVDEPIPENYTDQESGLDIPSKQEILPILEELYDYIDELEHCKGNKVEGKSRAPKEEDLEENTEEFKIKEANN
jgi:tetratricopeptide (TPR) repeat protein